MQNEFLPRVCEQCKKDFLIPRIDIERGKSGYYCSRKCALISHKLNFRINHKKNFGTKQNNEEKK